MEVETLEAGEEEANIPEVEDTAEGEDQVAGEAVTKVAMEADDQVAGEVEDQAEAMAVGTDQVAGDVKNRTFCKTFLFLKGNTLSLKLG